MKEVELFDVVMEMFLNRESCTYTELYDYVYEYSKEHDCYVPYDKNEMYHLTEIVGIDYFYDDRKNSLIRKQETIVCPCCGTHFRKYPDVEKFEKIKNYHK